MITPYDYYAECDSIAETISDVKRNIDAINTFAQSNSYTVFWRGQANHEWGLMSSLVRKLSDAAVVDDKLLDHVEDALLQEAERWIADLQQSRYSAPLAKLAYLQHHGVPTRLLDFTKSPWMALFFAAESVDCCSSRSIVIRSLAMPQ